MDVSLAVLADYANVSREGKLNIMGIFDRIFVRQLPGRFPPMQLVVRLDVRPAELDTDHAIRVQMAGPGGAALFDINGNFRPAATEPGQTVSVNHIIQLANLPLEQTGKHQVLIWVDNDLKREIDLHVTRAPEPPTPEPGAIRH